MEFFNSKKFIIAMLIVLVWAGISGCTTDDVPNKQAPHETLEELNNKITKEMDAMDKEKAAQDMTGPGDFQSIADALGCMFAPDNCPVKQRIEEQKMDR